MALQSSLFGPGWKLRRQFSPDASHICLFFQELDEAEKSCLGDAISGDTSTADASIPEVVEQDDDGELVLLVDLI